MVIKRLGKDTSTKSSGRQTADTQAKKRNTRKQTILISYLYSWCRRTCTPPAMATRNLSMASLSLLGWCRWNPIEDLYVKERWYMVVSGKYRSGNTFINCKA